MKKELENSISNIEKVGRMYGLRINVKAMYENNETLTSNEKHYTRFKTKSAICNLEYLGQQLLAIMTITTK